jgi:hypothetical protein
MNIEKLAHWLFERDRHLSNYLADKDTCGEWRDQVASTQESYRRAAIEAASVLLGPREVDEPFDEPERFLNPVDREIREES